MTLESENTLSQESDCGAPDLLSHSGVAALTKNEKQSIEPRRKQCASAPRRRDAAPSIHGVRATGSPQ